MTSLKRHDATSTDLPEMARPNKFMDAAKLEEFTKTEHPNTFEEWELEYSHLLDLWDYLEIECDTALTEFKSWYRRGG